MKTIYNARQNDYYIQTDAVFEACTAPRRKPDYTSQSGSRYWYSKEGLTRSADHWGDVAQCRWLYKKGARIAKQLIRKNACTGFVKWGDIDTLAAMRQRTNCADTSVKRARAAIRKMIAFAKVRYPEHDPVKVVCGDRSLKEVLASA